MQEVLLEDMSLLAWLLCAGGGVTILLRLFPAIGLFAPLSRALFWFLLTSFAYLNQ